MENPIFLIIKGVNSVCLQLILNLSNTLNEPKWILFAVWLIIRAIRNWNPSHLSPRVCVNCGKKIVLFLQINPKITFKWSIDRIASPAEIDRWFFVSSLKWILVEKRLHVPMAFIWNISSHPKCLESLDSGIFCVISGAIDVARHV